VNQKIHLKAAAVDMTQDLHQPRLNSATVHTAQYMQNPDRPTSALVSVRRGHRTKLQSATSGPYFNSSREAA
jgi:hypothetical protein